MKTGVITFFNYCNYGAVLQAYALSETLKEMGHEVTYIDYRCPHIAHPFGLRSLWKRGLIDYVYNAAGNIFYLPRRKKFREFREGICHTGPVTPENIRDFADCYDKYIAGSDQLWSARLTDFDKTYLLDFVRDPHKKFSYAASFGGASVEEAYREEYGRLLREFEAISVREDYGAQMVQELSGRSAEVSVDPTLLLTPSQWSALAAKGKSRRPYILVYQLGFSRTLIQAVRQVKKKTGLKVYYVPFPLGGAVGARCHLALGPREWLRLFKNAEYVLTDSFHGIVFALLFEKKFQVVVDGQHKNRRVQNLMEKLNLTERILGEHAVDIDEEIDYKEVKRILAGERQKSLLWLKEHI